MVTGEGGRGGETGGGKDGKPAIYYLLSDHISVVGGFGFESAVICPEVDRGGNARDASFVDL